VRAVPSDTSALFSEHRGSLVDYATGIVGSRAQAEDLVQEAFIRFAPVQRSGAGIEQPLAYLYRIVRNLALDSTRRRTLEHRQRAGEPAWWMVPVTPRTPEEELRHRQNVERVAQALRELPKETRLAVEMHRLGGYTLQEVADHLGLSVATVHRMVREALVKIGSRMTPRDL
jgi:RNA polymerase sigma-70 factor (ECF subfamily)